MEISRLCMGCMGDKNSQDVCPHCGWVEGTLTESPHHLVPRTVLVDKYMIGRVLGQGGFGITYKAWDINLHMRLAIKEYFPQSLVSRIPEQSRLSVGTGDMRSHYDYGLSRFLEEARTLARFDGHPNIVNVRDFFTSNDTAYMVMNYIEGITFKEYIDLNGGKIPFDKTRDIMISVMDALRVIHAEGMMHRDISPDNITIDIKGRVILIDFGAARQEMQDKSRNFSVILKPGYAPEEQYRRQGRQGPWTDVYAAAATMYRAITGHIPPDSLDRLEEDTLIPPSELGVNMSPAQEFSLLKALAVRAKDRYQTVEEFQNSLVPGKECLSYDVEADLKDVNREENNTFPVEDSPIQIPDEEKASSQEISGAHSGPEQRLPSEAVEKDKDYDHAEHKPDPVNAGAKEYSPAFNHKKAPSNKKTVMVLSILGVIAFLGIGLVLLVSNVYNSVNDKTGITMTEGPGSLNVIDENTEDDNDINPATNDMEIVPNPLDESAPLTETDYGVTSEPLYEIFWDYLYWWLFDESDLIEGDFTMIEAGNDYHDEYLNHQIPIIVYDARYYGDTVDVELKEGYGDYFAGVRFKWINDDWVFQEIIWRD